MDATVSIRTPKERPSVQHSLSDKGMSVHFLVHLRDGNKKFQIRRLRVYLKF